MKISAEGSGTWARRALAALLVVVALYLLAIDQLSPHHLPGLRWFAFCVFAAGPTCAFASTRFHRIEAAFALTAVLCGVIATVDIATTGGHAPSPPHAQASAGPRPTRTPSLL